MYRGPSVFELTGGQIPRQADSACRSLGTAETGLQRVQEKELHLLNNTCTMLLLLSHGFTCFLPPSHMTNQRGGIGSAKTDGVHQGKLQYQVILSCGSTVRFYKLTEENLCCSQSQNPSDHRIHCTAGCPYSVRIWGLHPPPLSPDTLHQHLIFSPYHFPLLFNKP